MTCYVRFAARALAATGRAYLWPGPRFYSARTLLACRQFASPYADPKSLKKYLDVLLTLLVRSYNLPVAGNRLLHFSIADACVW